MDTEVRENISEQALRPDDLAILSEQNIRIKRQMQRMEADLFALNQFIDVHLLRHGITMDESNIVVKLKVILDSRPASEIATITHQSNLIANLARANGAMQLALERALLVVNTDNALGTEVDEMIRRALEIQKESQL